MTQNTDTLPKPDVPAAPSSGPWSGPSPAPDARPAPPKLPKEIGGPAGPEPTRYGDWEQKGRCTDF
jgi:hypothetical protein